MPENTSLIVTSISEPNKALKMLAQGCAQNNWDFIVIGDQKSPQNFSLEGCDFYSLDRQLNTGHSFARMCPVKKYSRKNIGYLLAMEKGSRVIVETDDDNLPMSAFWDERKMIQDAVVYSDKGWLNIYRYFTDINIWPRGLPLNSINAHPDFSDLESAGSLSCPVQQGLADDNPDVDAVYRLVLPLPVTFNKNENIVLAKNVWCPFNSQNTTWFSDAFPLLYLPSYCSFRMTDIWRSFVAQRIAWENGWGVLFHKPTVYQERNEHDLIVDFSQEIPGYLNNHIIAEELEKLSLLPGKENIQSNMLVCYEALIKLQLVEIEELKLLQSWFDDINQILNTGSN
jgi:hypothetical protein